MSAFSMKLNVGRTAIAAAPAEAIKAGEAENALDIILTVVHVLPISAGPGQPPMMAPLGDVTFSIGREQAVEFFKTGLSAAEDLPPESDLVIANDLGAAEKLGQDLDNFRGNGSQS